MPSSAWKKDVCRSEEHTSELQSLTNLVCRLLLEKNKHARRGPGRGARAGRSRSRLSRVMSLRCGLRVCGRCGGVVGRVDSLWSFFFNDTATTEIYTLSLHDALPF